MSVKFAAHKLNQGNILTNLTVLPAATATLQQVVYTVGW